VAGQMEKNKVSHRNENH